jgi:predicted dehydrogenase
MPDPMRIALFGAGHLGKIHGKLLKENPNAELVAIVDPDTSAAKAVAKGSKAEVFASHQDLLASGSVKPQAAVIAAPTTLHHAIAMDLLGAGIHCLVEKPITSTVVQAEELVALAEERKLTLAVGHVERYNPVMIAARPEVGDVKFIECRRVSPYPFRSTDVGVTMDVMIHDIDLILDLVGKPLERVDACGAKVFSSSEDIANARLVFEGGAVADVTASRVALKAERKLRVFQGNSYMSLDLLNKKGVIYRKSPDLANGKIDPGSLSPAQTGGNPLEFILKKLVSRKKLKIPKVNPIVCEQNDFIAAARTGAQAPVSGARGLAALRAAEMILENMRDL